MNRFIITLTALIILLPSCGNKETSTKKNNPIEVLTEDWLDVFATDFHTANSQFEELVKVQETNITSEELEEKVIKTINYMDSLIVKSTVYSITGKNAEELKKSAENYKEKNNVFYQAVINYSNVIKENSDFLLKKEWGDEEDAKFKEIIIPIEDQVFYAIDEVHNASLAFSNAQKEL